MTVGILALSANSRADESDSPSAEAFFRAGREAFDRGDYEAACARFEESYRLDSAVGTLLNWAVCDDDRGKLANAWERYRRLLDLLEKKDPRVQLVRLRLSKIEDRVPFLTLAFGASAPTDSVVYFDGVLLTRASLGVPLPMNPGAHEVVVRAEGMQPARYAIRLEERQHSELVLFPGAPIPRAAVPVLIPAPHRSTPPPSPASHAPRQSAPNTIGWVALGAGAASLVAAGVLGFVYLAKRGTLDDHCPDKRCDPEGLQAIGALRLLEPAIAVTVGAGVVGIGAGVLTLSLSPPIPKKQGALPTSIGSPFVAAEYRF